MALDYTLTKYFVGSHEARRFVPFRRKRKVVRESIFDPIKPTDSTGLFDQVTGSDALVGLGLLYSGQTQQLPAAPKAGERNISLGSTQIMLPAITSFYRPEVFLLDLAIRKQNMYQRFKYDSAEVYSSGPGFLISAGGVTSGFAYSGSGIEAIDKLKTSDDDLGTALPTTVFLSGFPGHTTLDSLIRIEGVRDDKDEYRTWDHNLCVWAGFACGLNVTVPASFEACAQPAPLPAQNEWRFIDTAAPACGAVAGSLRQFVVIYREACRTADTGCAINFGFIEVLEAGTESLAAFMSRTVAANPKGFIVPFNTGGVLPMGGTYHSARNADIQFLADAHQQDSDKWGISSVNGIATKDLDDWDFAVGDVVTADGKGLVRMTNAALKDPAHPLVTLELDMTSKPNPIRTIK